MVWRGISGRGARSERGHGMATIQRPVKTYGNRTYVAEVAAAPSNQDPILANEVDGDIDTIYAAWNGGADAVNIKDGAISRAKLSATDVLPSLPPIPIATDANKTVVVNTAGNGLILGTGGTFAGSTPPATPQVGQLWWRSDPDGNLFIYYDDGNSKQFVPAVPSSVGPWSVSGATVTPTDATKTVTIPAGPSSVTFGSRTTKGHLIAHPTFDGVYFGFNTCINAAGSAWVQDDAAKASWMFGAQTDQFYVSRQPAGGALAQLLTLDNAGNLTLAGGYAYVAGVHSGIDGTSTQAELFANHPWSPSDLTKTSWLLALNQSADQMVVYRRAANAAVGAVSTLLTLDNAGQMTLAAGLVVGGQINLPNAGNIQTWLNSGSAVTDVYANNGQTVGTSRPQWDMRLDTGADTAGFLRRAPNAGAYVNTVVSTATGDFTISAANEQNASGTTWVNPSDIRLKKNIAQYARGLAEILQLDPISYTLKQHDIDTCGFDAEAVRAVFPECVGTTKMKVDPDDEEETEVLTLDIHPILIALVNAVKELAGKVGQ